MLPAAQTPETAALSPLKRRARLSTGNGSKSAPQNAGDKWRDVGAFIEASCRREHRQRARDLCLQTEAPQRRCRHLRSTGEAKLESSVAHQTAELLTRLFRSGRLSNSTVRRWTSSQSVSRCARDGATQLSPATERRKQRVSPTDERRFVFSATPSNDEPNDFQLKGVAQEHPGGRAF